MAQQTTKPVKQFRCGALNVSVWEREHKGDVYHSATASRAYKDDDKDEWRYSDQFNREDLPVVAALLNQAFSWIVAQQAQAKAKEQKK